MEAHHLTDKEREDNEGRSQILNLLMIDSEKISTIASRFWSITNAILSCE